MSTRMFSPNGKKEMIESLIDHVYIGRLRGFKYPSIQHENGLFQSYFQSRTHELHCNQVIYIVEMIDKHCQITEVVVYPYLISKLEGILKSSTGQDNQIPTTTKATTTATATATATATSITHGITSKTTTKLSFDGKYHIHNHHYSDVYGQGVQEWLKGLASQHSLPPSFHVPTCIMLPILPKLTTVSSKMLFPLHIKRDKKLLIGDNDMYLDVEMEKYLHSAKLSNASYQYQASTKIIMGVLSSRHKSQHSLKHRSMLLDEGILLDLSNGVDISGICVLIVMNHLFILLT